MRHLVRRRHGRRKAGLAERAQRQEQDLLRVVRRHLRQLHLEAGEPGKFDPEFAERGPEVRRLRRRRRFRSRMSRRWRVRMPPAHEHHQREGWLTVRPIFSFCSH